MEVDNHHFCELLRMEPVARMPDEDLLHSEVAIMSGGRDQSGRPLVTFPAQNHGILESRVMGSGLDRILRYYINITSPTTKVHGFAFIADLRFSSIDFISMLKSSLNSLQAETSSVVGPFVLYLIQPINKKSLKDTQTLLALRQSKKKSNKHIPSTLFQTTLVVDEMDLYNHVDKSQLTADLGGYLQYSHSAWVRFRKTVEPFFLQYEEMIPKLPDVFSRLEELESFDLGEKKADLERQSENIQQLLRDLIRELGIDTLSQQCNNLLTKINQSDIDEVFAAVAQKPVFREVRLLAEYCREKLTMIQQRLDAARDRVEGRVTDEMTQLELLEDVEQLSKWLLSEGPSGLQKLEIADSLGKAEMLCNHFETGVASLALEKLALGESLQEQVQLLISEEDNGFANLKSAVRDLEGHAENYQSMLDDRRHLLSTVRNFYGLYDKIARWCVKALKFLPHDIVDLHNDIRSEQAHGRHRQDVGDTEYRWIEDVERFLRKHQPPKEEEVMTMAEYAETIGERVRKKKAKHLSNRYTILLRVLNTNDLASEKDVLQSRKWKSEVVGSHDGGRGERSKGVTRERKDGDGLEEESRTEAAEKSEMESDVDDPLLRRIRRHTPSKDIEARGQRSKRRSSKGKVNEKQEEKRSSDSDSRRTENANVEKNSVNVAQTEKGDKRTKMEKDDGRNERENKKMERGTESEEGSKWIRPSKDFWAGRIPGVVRQNQAQTDEMDGHPSDIAGPKDSNSHMAGRMPTLDQSVLNGNSPHLVASNPGAFHHSLNRNQNANPSPGYGPPLQSLHGNVGSPSQLQGFQNPINQSHLGNFPTSQSHFPPPGFNQSPYSIPQAGGDLVTRHHTHVTNVSAHSCTLYDPVTGLPYQAYIQSPRSSSLQGDPWYSGYLSDSHHSNPGMEYHREQRGYPNVQRPVDQHISGMRALHDLVRPTQHQVTSQERMHSLNIGLSSSMQDRSHSRSTTPHSEHNRELSPYEDVLNRIGQMRVRARRGKNSRDKSRTARQAEMRAAKSVPNLSNLLAGVQVDGVGNEGLNQDRQSDYYARLAHLDDQAGRCSSEHATKKWVSRLMADDLHYADSSSLRSALPSLPSGIVRNEQRPLTPHEKFELESLTSLLNESDDDNDDSAPMSNSPRDEFRLGDMSADLTQTRVLPTRPPNIDFDADQRELDQIRQNLSGSYPAPPNTDLGMTFDHHQANDISPNQLHGSLSSAEISPLHYPSAHSTLTYPVPTSHSTHSIHHPVSHSYSSHHQNQTSPFHSGGVTRSSAGAEGLAPMTEQLRDYFGDVGVTEDELVQHGLEERLRNIHVNQVQERVTHEDLSTPNFLAEAMNTLVKLDSADPQQPLGRPLEARLQRNPSLQFSDEGVIIDGASWDGTLGSAATTERGSIESGVGSRGQASNT